MAHFLGPDHGRHVEENPDFLKVILEKSGVDYMKGIFNTSQETVCEIFGRNRNLTHTKEDNTEPKDVLFVRHGKVGGWKELFKREHLRKFEERINEVFNDSDNMTL